jgi:hypothetical protein
MSTRKAKPVMSPLLEVKPVEEILSPTARPFEYAGQTYQILPMPDSSLMIISDALGGVASVVDGVAQAFAGGGLKASDLVPFIPEIIRALLPNASKLIAASLGISADEAAAIPLARKLEALKLIIEAEDIPLILKNWGALVGTFLQPETMVVSTPAPAEGSTEPLSTT